VLSIVTAASHLRRDVGIVLDQAAGGNDHRIFDVGLNAHVRDFECDPAGRASVVPGEGPGNDRFVGIPPQSRAAIALLARLRIKSLACGPVMLTRGVPLSWSAVSPGFSIVMTCP
jgi:hypothetical protein